MRAKTVGAVAKGAERPGKQKKAGGSWKHDFLMNKWLYLLTIPVVAYFLIFNYLPMGGLLMALENYKPTLGLLKSQWVGLQNFRDFFMGPSFWTILRNTPVISLLNLAIAFPLSIAFALLLNEMNVLWVKKLTQTISYMPYFISIVVLCGLVTEFCSSRGGVITNLMVSLFHIPRENLLTTPDYFWTPIPSPCTGNLRFLVRGEGNFGFLKS